MRIVTLRNFAWFTLVSLLAFAAISLRSELRGRHMQDYGRLIDHQLDAKVERKPVEVVEETGQARAPVLHHEPMEIVSLDVATPPPAAVSSASVAPVPGDSRVAIVGGPEGVKIVQQTARRPLLRGGFGR
ncbi:MAG TPA: hypothetical protein VKB93_28095 [Thermoanaerobaculia bacterium]|nr:hypothetical protein [Thermoanaerobaculia bacterium]